MSGLSFPKSSLGEITARREISGLGAQTFPQAFISGFRIITGMNTLAPSSLSSGIYFVLIVCVRNVGMFRYWTLSNIPLFLLAAPTLLIMIVSGKWGVGIEDKTNTQSLVFEEALVHKLALSQLLLAVMAIVSYHVQIVTRLSSGYMVWYWWVAYQMSTGGKGKEGIKQEDWAQWIVRYMVLYGVVQGVLFAGFLPPA